MAKSEEPEEIKFMLRLPTDMHAELKRRMDTALQLTRMNQVKLPRSRVSPVTMNDQIVEAINAWLSSRESEEYFYKRLADYGVDREPPRPPKLSQWKPGPRRRSG